MNNHSKKILSMTLCGSILALGLVSTANAALVSTLGGLAVYDTDRDISWLANANAAAGTTFDDGLNVTNGRMTWVSANAWAASLNVGGVTGWRLPSSLNSDGSEPCFGLNCRDSEMGHLFYTELSGTYPNSILFNGDPDLALFSNVQADFFWSGTEFALNPDYAWFFSFHGGLQFKGNVDAVLLAWAVHSGDVGALSLPEPGTIALMGLGLAGLLGFGRRQRRR